MTKRLWLTCSWIVFFFISSCSPSAYIEQNPTPVFIPQYTQHIQGTYHFVVVEKGYANDRRTLQNLVEKVCDQEAVCFVLIWEDETKAAQSLPVADDQSDSLIAEYKRNFMKGIDVLQLCSAGECDK